MEVYAPLEVRILEWVKLKGKVNICRLLLHQDIQQDISCVLLKETVALSRVIPTTHQSSRSAF